MKNLTFALIAFTLLFTACRTDDDDNSLTKEKKLVRLVYTPNADGNQSIANYLYDDQGRLIEIAQQNPYLVFYIFTYMPDGRVEKIKSLKDFQSHTYIDYTFYYETESKIPNRIRYSGAVPTHTTDVLNIDNALFWNNEDGDEFVMDGLNTTNNTFYSLVNDGTTYTLQYNNQIKNGLETQSALNIPVAMTNTYLGFWFFSGLQVSSPPIKKIESSDGYLYNSNYQTDAAGYITKNGLEGGIEFYYQ